VEGAIYQMLNHGLSTGALFLCVGILYERSHTHLIKDYGGVSSQMPIFSALFFVMFLCVYEVFQLGLNPGSILVLIRQALSSLPVF